MTQAMLRSSWALPAPPFVHDCFTHRGLRHVHSLEEWLHDHCEIFPRVVSPTLNQLVSHLLREANGARVRGSPSLLSLCAVSCSAVELDGVLPWSEITLQRNLH